MANVFPVFHILLLFHSPKGSWNKSAKYEKLGKYWSYCTRNRAITNACVWIMTDWLKWFRYKWITMVDHQMFQIWKHFLFDSYVYLLYQIGLTLHAPCISESYIKIKINLNVYFHTSFWCFKRLYEGLKRFYEGFKSFVKPFKAPQRSVKIKI